MGHSKNPPPYWDRTSDDTGRQIRDDVRDSAVRIWKSLHRQVERITGESDEAGQLLENAVRVVSIYLDKKQAPPQDASGLLTVAVKRLAYRTARKLKRVEAVGGSTELEDLLSTSDWTEQVDRRIFLQELMSNVRPRTRGILRLRMEGFEWEEIARMLRTDAATLRIAFWRDVRKTHLQLLSRPNIREEEE
ncbi:MAG: hypothetical protein JWQ87_5290 [Candidatus Sulfotelmatobacter sp.]|nr:hypothetical protein [Candidatus Sulfotelmatobacter sp.]